MSDTNLISQKLLVSLKYKYNAWLFFLDHFIRIILIIFYLQNIFPTYIFIISQFLLLGIEIPLYNNYLKRIKKEQSIYINKIYAKENPEISIDEEVPIGYIVYQALFGFIFSFWFFLKIIESHTWYNYILIIFLTFLSTAICIIPALLTIRFRQSIGIISAKALLQKEYKDQKNIIQFAYQDVSNNYPNIFTSDKLIGYGTVELFPIDINDTRIAKLESEIKSINYRSEAWILESVFLGGLAFSGFLTVASANFLGKEPEVFAKFIVHCEKYFEKCSNNNVMTWMSEIQSHFFRNDLYIIIMLLCLLSSVFFFLVLILRFRLNTLSLNIDHLIRILTIFNAKEEELFNLNNSSDTNDFQNQRLDKIQKKIDTALIDAEDLLKELKPTSIMINVYRTIAVFLFYAVLVISGFYFIPSVSVFIFLLFVFTQIFGVFEKYSRLERIKNLLKKH